MPLAPLKKEDAPQAELAEAWEYYHTPRCQHPNAGVQWGVGFVSMILSAMVLWGTRKGGTPSKWVYRHAAVWAPLLPVIAISIGWIFTEIGRQPWIVYGLMTTATGVSPAVSAGEVLFSMIVYTLVYAVLAVIEVKLFLTYVRKGADPFQEPVKPEDVDEDAPFQFAY